jgi:hypothetical protein
MKEQNKSHRPSRAPPTDLQSPSRAELRKRVRWPQPLPFRPRPRYWGALLGTLPTEHREEHAVVLGEALDLRHGRLEPHRRQAEQSPFPSKSTSHLHVTDPGTPKPDQKSLKIHPNRHPQTHESREQTSPRRDLSAESAARQMNRRRSRR